MKIALTIFLSFMHLYYSFGQDKQTFTTCLAKEISDTSTIQQRVWLHSIEREIKFLQTLNDERYKGYLEPSGDADYLFGNFICYISDSFLKNASMSFVKLGLPSIEHLKGHHNDIQMYREYMNYLRLFIDTDAFLHSDEEMAYAWTNARGINLFDLELYVTQLILYVERINMNTTEYDNFIIKHNHMMKYLEDLFSRTYNNGAITQMSGLTGDTCRDCWPFLRLYNKVLYGLLLFQEVEQLDEFYKKVPMVLANSTACSFLYEEVVRELNKPTEYHLLIEIINSDINPYNISH